MSEGTLFIVSAPSGAGKTSLVAELLEGDPSLQLSISHTTRPRRPKETGGVNYHFVGKAQFERMIAADAFLEHASVFGNYYGTSKAAVAEPLAAGRDVLLEIDWQGAALVRQVHPEAVSIFIVPPSQAALRERLQGRAQDDPEVIESRLAEAKTEMRHYGEFDYLVVNDVFEAALEELRAIVLAERCRVTTRAARNSDLMASLLA
ncbi:MAG: guanylate kinase [Gammaproteobacteria bacterium]|jgi:guanylate kinase|nr:MAG: guanylate kinase [Gammaproteobacteria bacterium]